MRHRRAVALDEVRFLRFVTKQRAGLPLVEEEVLDGASDVGPERLAIRLENGPLRAFVNRAFEVDEVPAQVDVLPFGIGTDRAGAPEPEAAAFEEAKTINAFGIQHLLLAFVDQLLEPDREVHHFVRRRFPDGALNVVPRVDAGHKTARRQVQFLARDRVEHRHPRIINRRVFRIELCPDAAHVGDAHRRRAVEHSDAIAHFFGVTDERPDDRVGVVAEMFIVRRAAGRGDDRNIFDVFKLFQPRLVSFLGIVGAFVFGKARPQAVVAADERDFVELSSRELLRQCCAVREIVASQHKEIWEEGVDYVEPSPPGRKRLDHDRQRTRLGQRIGMRAELGEDRIHRAGKFVLRIERQIGPRTQIVFTVARQYVDRDGDYLDRVAGVRGWVGIKIQIVPR